MCTGKISKLHSHGNPLEKKFCGIFHCAQCIFKRRIYIENLSKGERGECFPVDVYLIRRRKDGNLQISI